MRKTSLGAAIALIGSAVVIAGVTHMRPAAATPASYAVSYVTEGAVPADALKAKVKATCVDPNQNAESSETTLSSSSGTAAGGTVALSMDFGTVGPGCAISAKIYGPATTVVATNRPWVSLEVNGVGLDGPKQVASAFALDDTGAAILSPSAVLPRTSLGPITVRVHYDDPGTSTGAKIVFGVWAAAGTATAGPTAVNTAVTCNAETHDVTYPLLAGGTSKSVYFATMPSIGQSCSAVATVKGPGSTSTANFVWIEHGGSQVSAASQGSTAVANALFANGNAIVVNVASGPPVTIPASSSSSTAATTSTTTTTTSAPTTTTTTSTTIAGSPTSTSSTTSTVAGSGGSTTTTLNTYRSPAADISASATTQPGSASPTPSGGTTTTTRPSGTTTTTTTTTVPKPGVPQADSSLGVAVKRPTTLPAAAGPALAGATTADVAPILPDAASKGAKSRKVTSKQLRTRLVTKCSNVRVKGKIRRVCKTVRVKV